MPRLLTPLPQYCIILRPVSVFPPNCVRACSVSSSNHCVLFPRLPMVAPQGAGPSVPTPYPLPYYCMPGQLVQLLRAHAATVLCGIPGGIRRQGCSAFMVVRLEGLNVCFQSAPKASRRLVAQSQVPSAQVTSKQKSSRSNETHWMHKQTQTSATCKVGMALCVKMISDSIASVLVIYVLGRSSARSWASSSLSSRCH